MFWTLALAAYFLYSIDLWPTQLTVKHHVYGHIWSYVDYIILPKSHNKKHKTLYLSPTVKKMLELRRSIGAWRMEFMRPSPLSLSTLPTYSFSP
jgi:hypothetical protein